MAWWVCFLYINARLRISHCFARTFLLKWLLPMKNVLIFAWLYLLAQHIVWYAKLHLNSKYCIISYVPLDINNKAFPEWSFSLNTRKIQSEYILFFYCRQYVLCKLICTILDIYYNFFIYAYFYMCRIYSSVIFVGI